MEDFQRITSSHAAANVVHSFKEEILDKWSDEVRENITSAHNESRATLKNNLPLFLDNLAHALEYRSVIQKNEAITLGQEHGEHRAFSSVFTVDEIAEEYKILRKTVFETLLANNVFSWDISAIVNEMIDQALQKAIKDFQTLRDDTLLQIIWLADAKGNLIYVNKGWQKFTGRFPEEDLGEEWLNKIHPEDRAGVRKAWDHSMRTGARFENEYRLLNAEGEYRWVLARGEGLRNTKGIILNWLGASTDINEQKRRERQLLQLAQTSLLLNSTISLSEKFNIIIDHARDIIEAHQAVISITVDQKWSQDINAVSLSEKYKEWRNYKGRTESLGLYSYVCKSSKPLRLTQEELEKHQIWENLGAFQKNHPPLRGWLAVPLVSSSGKNFGILQLSDKFKGEFTEADEAILVQLSQIASAAIENSNLLIREKEAVRARDEFLSIASHELKTPLTSIKLQSQMLKKGIDRKDPRAYSPERINQLVNQTEKQVSRLVRLIDDMLDISRIRTGRLGIEKEKFELCDVLTDVLSRMKVQFDNADMEEPLVEFCEESHGYWDRMRIEQVLTNLLTNAIRYGKGKPVRIRIESLHETIRIYVKDEGIGIARENLHKIFDRFERAVNANEISGMGLGLFITKQIVKAHGGEIWVESELGKGSEFIVELPRFEIPISEKSIHGI